jgi:hypothetical protein
MKNDFVIAAVGSLVFLVVLFVIGREIVCWYLKINIRLSVLIEIRDLLKGNTKQDQIKSVVSNQQSQDFNVESSTAKSSNSSFDRYEPSFSNEDQSSTQLSEGLIKKSDLLDGKPQLNQKWLAGKARKVTLIFAILLIGLLSTSAYVYKTDIVSGFLNKNILNLHSYSEWFGSWDCESSNLQIYPDLVLWKSTSNEFPMNYKFISKPPASNFSPKELPVAYYKQLWLTKSELLKQHPVYEPTADFKNNSLTRAKLLESMEIIDSIKFEKLKPLHLLSCWECDGASMFILNEDKLIHLAHIPIGDRYRTFVHKVCSKIIRRD